MRVTKTAAVAAALSLAAMTAQAGTLEDVQARGELNCVVTTGLAGFAAPDENGVWKGFDVGDNAGDVRFGNQVLSWGESTFIQGGINTINPIDVSPFVRHSSRQCSTFLESPLVEKPRKTSPGRDIASSTQRKTRWLS